MFIPFIDPDLINYSNYSSIHIFPAAILRIVRTERSNKTKVRMKKKETDNIMAILCPVLCKKRTDARSRAARGNEYAHHER